MLSPWLYYDVIYREFLPLAASRGVIFAVVFAASCRPTFLMGFSLPFLQGGGQPIAGSAKLIGSLYGLDTLGTGIGAFVGGWYLIGTFGFEKAIYVAAAFDLVVAAGPPVVGARPRYGRMRRQVRTASAPDPVDGSCGARRCWCSSAAF